MSALTLDTPQYVAAGKATKALGVCRATLVKYVKASLIDGHKTPTGKWRFNVESYLKERVSQRQAP